MEDSLTPVYVVTYAVAIPKIYNGVIGSFSSVFAAKKFKERAELALKNSGLEGSVEMSVCIPGDTQDLNKFFEEFEGE